MNMRREQLLILAGSLMLGIFWVPPTVPAQPAEPAPPLVASQSLRDNLQRLQAGKKPVELVLKNGKSYRGRLGEIGDHAVVVTQIEGREFFDAYVVLDEISVVEVRARER